VLLAVTLIIVAVLLTCARFVISGIDDYKAQLVEWVVKEHDLNVNAEKVSAGIDFSGLVLTLNNVEFVDTEALPFDLQIDNLFLHFDFLDSIRKQQVVFNDISIKGANLSLKVVPKDPNAGALGPEPQTQSQITLEALKNIFLLRLSSFSITDSQISFIDHLVNKQTILIQELSWVNDKNQHQGIGKASLPNTSEENSLEFIVNVDGDAEGPNDQLIGTLYASADNINVSDYLTSQINPLVKLKTALISLKLWGDFDFNGPKTMQLEWGNSEIAWSLLEQPHEWRIDSGSLQFSYQKQHWLFDSYDLGITHNYVPSNEVKITGTGTLAEFADFDLTGINVNDVMPFAMLFSSLNESQIKEISDFEIGGQVSKLGVSLDQYNELNLNVAIADLNTQAVGSYPAITDADIFVSSNQKRGSGHIQLNPQELNFNGQFNRAVPLQKADLLLNWKNDKNGFELSSDNSLIVTDEFTSSTQFSILFPATSSTNVATQKTEANDSPILSLFSSVSLNDASKAQHYFPMQAMGDDVYNYLQPTLKKGSVEGAKILWQGRLADYPFTEQQGTFQAWIPVRNAKYDFYPGWQGLSDLDLTLLFDNDALSMYSDKAKLGGISINKLSAKIDHLAERGILTIDADIDENAQYMANYLNNSPLQESVGKAIEIIRIKKSLQGNLNLTIPLSSKNGDVKAAGTLNLKNNDVELLLGSDTVLSLQNVNGAFSFVNGNLSAKKLTGTLFQQPVTLSFSSEDLNDKYQFKADLFGQWDITKLSQSYKQLNALKLSGGLDWQGQINFMQYKGKDYQFAINLDSQLQGIKVDLPAPYNKNSLQSWPTKISVSANPQSTQWVASINNKLNSSGQLTFDNQDTKLKYLYLGLGNKSKLAIDKTKQVIRVNENKVDLTPWVKATKDFMAENDLAPAPNESSLLNIDSVYVDIKQAEIFGQPLLNLSSKVSKSSNKWLIGINSDNLLANIDYRQGMPDRYDINIKKLNLQLLDNQQLADTFASEQQSGLSEVNENLREDYPEIFLECALCYYKGMDLSSLKAHFFPNSATYNIDYLKLGQEDQMTNISGVWDQQRTNIIIDSSTDSDNSIVERLGYPGPMTYDNADFTAALNWIGAPWQFNLDSLSGELSLKVEDGLITEVDDKGARLLSFLSLDGIRRSLNLEFGGVFSKGLGFDDMSLSGKITNGVFKNEDYYLDGSAGKVSGSGLIDLLNLNVNYRFSYSPAVTSSLPVLAAFAINPLTGAAVLMLTEILEPVVDAIIRVDFSVKGSLKDPQVKIEERKRGLAKLENTEVLQEIEGQQQ